MQVTQNKHKVNKGKTLHIFNNTTLMLRHKSFLCQCCRDHTVLLLPHFQMREKKKSKSVKAKPENINSVSDLLRTISIPAEKTNNTSKES